MKFIVIIVLSVLIFSCQNNTKPKSEKQVFEEFVRTYYKQKLGCDEASINEWKSYSSKFKLQHKYLVLELCQCDSINKKITKDYLQDTIISISKILFNNRKNKEFKYYSIHIYDDFYKHEFNKVINLKYDSLKKDFYFYSNELMPN